MINRFEFFVFLFACLMYGGLALSWIVNSGWPFVIGAILGMAIIPEVFYAAISEEWGDASII